MKIETLFENDHIIAFNKPSGLLSIPDRFDAEKPCLQKIVEQKYGKLFTVHRLDRDTSGVICFAKNENTHRYLSQLFQNRKVEKYYQAIVHGKPKTDTGLIKSHLAEHPGKRGQMMVVKKGKPAHTEYTILQTWNQFSLLSIQIFTGRTHQIRVHMQHIGNPVICDPLYGSETEIKLSAIKKGYKLSKIELEERPVISRLALHAASLKFTAEDGENIQIEAPLPKDMTAFIKQLSKIFN